MPKSPRKVVDPQVPELDRIIHERSRLAILTALTLNPTLAFNELKALLKTTDGNLSVHTRKLEAAGYLSCRKAVEGHLPRTEYSLTAAGRRAIERYFSQMEELIRSARR